MRYGRLDFFLIKDDPTRRRQQRHLQSQQTVTKITQAIKITPRERTAGKLNSNVNITALAQFQTERRRTNGIKELRD